MIYVNVYFINFCYYDSAQLDLESNVNDSIAHEC